MKKMFLMVAIALVLCGCNESSQIGDEVELDIVEVEYDGHQYIVFSGHGVIHNHKCGCNVL
jgi:hypothetical protein